MSPVPHSLIASSLCVDLLHVWGFRFLFALMQASCIVVHLFSLLWFRHQWFLRMTSFCCRLTVVLRSLIAVHVNIWPPALAECTWWKPKSVFWSFEMHLERIDFPTNESESLEEKETIFFILFFSIQNLFLYCFFPLSMWLSAQWKPVGIIMPLFLLPPTQTTYQFVSKRVAAR